MGIGRMIERAGEAASARAHVAPLDRLRAGAWHGY